MAYNNYFPVGYQQYPIYQQPMIQPQYQPQIQQPIQPQMQQTQASPSSIIWISSERDAALYPVAPNNAVALWNQNDPVVYLKQADASGKPSMKTYDLVERVDMTSESVEAKTEKVANYATKDDLGAVVCVVKDFDKAIVDLKSEIENMKGDLYGIAGKKKPAKKAETEDE